jgi:hypothetical protein
VEVEPLPTNGSLAPDDDKTDGSGFFEISLFAGTYNVQLTPDPANMQVPETQSITVSGATVMNVTLSAGATLTGTVTEPGGSTPASDVRVEAAGTGAFAVTDGSGNYSFLAPVGTHTLNLVDEGGSLEDMVLTPVSGVVVTTPGPVTQNIAVVLATSGSTVVQGTVVAPDGTTPVQGVTVTARDNAGDVIGKALTDVNGDYLLAIQ